jgi:hypothetical protein
MGLTARAATARAAGLALVVGAFAAGCGPAASTAPSAPSAAPPAAPSAAPSSTASQGPIAAPAVVTFEVAGGERFKVELATQPLVDHAARLLGGASGLAAIPLGTVVRGSPDVNAPWTWHLDPASFSFADVTVEVCDGIPSYVEDGTVTSPQFCPWSAKVVALEPKVAP